MIESFVFIDLQTLEKKENVFFFFMLFLCLPFFMFSCVYQLSLFSILTVIYSFLFRYCFHYLCNCIYHIYFRLYILLCISISFSTLIYHSCKEYRKEIYVSTPSSTAGVGGGWGKGRGRRRDCHTHTYTHTYTHTHTHQGGTFGNFL